MKKTTLLLFLLLINFSALSQTKPTDYGLKAGMNLSKYSGNAFASSYQFKAGFYAGGFASFDISQKFKVQPEILFALQGSNFVIEDIEVRENSDELSKVRDFKTKTTESTVSVPIVARYFVEDKFYFEAGPQLGIILERQEKITESPSEDPNFSEVQQSGHDTFDLGLAVGAGYVLNGDLTVNFRYFSGLIERDLAEVKSSVLNLGLEYKL